MHKPLIRFLFRFTHSVENIQEIANDTLLVVWQKAGDFEGKSKVSTWIMGIAVRRALKRMEKERRFEAISDEDLWQEAIYARDDIARWNLQQTLEWALTNLPREQSATIELAYFHGFTCEEIAEVFNCPVSTTKTRLHYARKRLRQLFEQCSEPLDVATLLGGHHESS